MTNLDKIALRMVSVFIANAAVISFVSFHYVNLLSPSIPTRNAVGFSGGFGPIDQLPIYLQIILYSLAIFALGQFLTLYFVMLLKFDNFLDKFFQLGVSSNP